MPRVFKITDKKKTYKMREKTWTWNLQFECAWQGSMIVLINDVIKIIPVQWKIYFNVGNFFFVHQNQIQDIIKLQDKFEV